MVVNSETVGEITGSGILALVGFAEGDRKKVISPMIKKLVNLRIFPDEKGRFDKSLLDISGSLLLVPQFTLYADTGKGRRPEFFTALNPEEACELFLFACEEAKMVLGEANVAQGVFGADMKVSLLNDGPVTIMLDG